jgi:TatD DNase family protein
LHVVKGFNEIIKLKKNLTPIQNWVIHGFNNYKQVNELLNNGFYLSFGKSILKNTKLQQVFIDCPIQKIVLETDDSNITIKKMYNFAAQLKDVSVDELTQHIRQNLNNITNGKLA